MHLSLINCFKQYAEQKYLNNLKLFNTSVPVPCMSGKTISSCNGTISLSCSIHQIILTSLDATETFASDILEHCNAHEKCQVHNPTNECVQVNYWCTKSKLLYLQEKIKKTTATSEMKMYSKFAR